MFFDQIKEEETKQRQQTQNINQKITQSQKNQKRFLMLKSRIHYRVGFRDLASEVVECAGLGVCTSDYNEISFSNVRRPIYPLDGVNTRIS